jgi:hypothetical protein
MSILQISALVENGAVAIVLSDILQEIDNGASMYWSILWLDATVYLGSNYSMLEIEHQINDSKKGLMISWEDLNVLSNKFYQIIDVIIIGCKDKSSLKCYDNNREMYTACDVGIEMIDSSYWKVFSKDQHLIDKLLAKFKKTELVDK